MQNPAQGFGKSGTAPKAPPPASLRKGAGGADSLGGGRAFRAARAYALTRSSIQAARACSMASASGLSRAVVKV